MAYDKAVDSGVLDAGLKLIADAIREKGGTEDTLAFPQAMADAIAGIQTGGGSLDEIIEGDFKVILSGSFTPATTGTFYPINGINSEELKNMGFNVNINDLSKGFGICFCDDKPSTTETGYIVVPSYANGVQAYMTQISNGLTSGSWSSNDLTMNNSKIKWALWSMLAGVTYYWIAFFK